MTTTDQVTLALTGELPFILIVSGCLGLLFSFLLLHLYRRAVRRGMARTAGESTTFAAPSAAPAEPPPPAPLAINYANVGKRDPVVLDSGALYRRARTAPWRA